MHDDMRLIKTIFYTRIFTIQLVYAVHIMLYERIKSSDRIAYETINCNLHQWLPAIALSLLRVKYYIIYDIFKKNLN